MTGKTASKTDQFEALCELVEELENRNLNYFLLHGTLLGLLRDGCLIPGDGDIDIGFDREKVSSEKLCEMMRSLGYEQHVYLGDFDSLYFVAGEVKVDLNLYRFNSADGMASCYWPVTKNNLLSKAIYNVAQGMTSDYSLGQLKGNFILSPAFDSALSSLLRLVGKTTPPALLNWIENLARANLLRPGFKVPASLIGPTKRLQISGKVFSIPSDPEALLEKFYGQDWLRPNSRYTWFEDSPAVVWS